MLRRHPFSIVAIVLLLLLGAGLFYLASYLGSDEYHERLQAELSAALGHPVRIGEAALSLRRGPALAVSDLHIEAHSVGISLRADLLYLRLDWDELLHGRAEFSRIVMLRPQLRIALPEMRAQAQIPPSPTPEQRLGAAGITSLTVENGRVVIEDRSGADGDRRFRIEQIDGEISDFGADRSAWVRLSGRLSGEQHAADFIAAGEIALGAGSWRQTTIRLGLLFEELPLRLLDDVQPLWAGNVSGNGRLEVTLDGSAAEGVRTRARLEGGTLTLGSANGAPIPPVELAATWFADDAAQGVRDLSLKLGEAVVHGNARWEPSPEGLWLAAQLRTDPLDLASLVRHLPGMTEDAPESVSGTVTLTHLEFAGLSTLLADGSALASALRAEALLDAVEVRLAPHPIERIHAELRLEDGCLEIAAGRATVLETPVRFSASLDGLFTPSPTVRGDARAIFAADRLLPLLPPPIREKLTVSGDIPMTVEAFGEPKEMRLAAAADLASLGLYWEPAFAKEAGRGGSLSLSLRAGAEAWSLDFARLSLPGLDLRANGSGHGFGEARLDVHLEAPELRKVHALIPPLQKIDARGGAEVRGVVTRTDGEIRSEGTLYLRRAGLRPPVVAEINEATGHIRLTSKGAQIENLTARLGTSAVRVEGELENFAEPRLQLHVRGETIRADEIIFPSADAVLHDVDGHLVIERGRVAFSPVNVRIEGGTIASVTGEVVDFSNPSVALEIGADYGDIDEVIALWIRRPEAGRRIPAPRRDHNPQVQVRIRAAVAEGKISNLSFEKAEGIISWEQGLLTIHPLHFHAAQGRCTGRVMVESADQRHLLYVSGHLEGAEASELQQNLLQQRGLVTGTVRSDFFIMGEIGDDFRRTAQGGVSLDVERGVLLRFNSLSKIFSFLNVSQLFSRQLPDPAREGMPFHRLSASFSLKDGVLQSEDLLIDSPAMNMSLVGEFDLVSEKVDALIAVKPLRTVDRIVTRIPVAGWILAGEEKALITAHFQLRGPFSAAEVVPVPVTSLSEKAVGIFRRIFGLPGRLIENLEDLARPE